MKQHINITVDAEVVKAAKKHKINISYLTERVLRQYIRGIEMEQRVYQKRYYNEYYKPKRLVKNV